MDCVHTGTQVHPVLFRLLAEHYRGNMCKCKNTNQYWTAETKRAVFFKRRANYIKGHARDYTWVQLTEIVVKKVTRLREILLCGNHYISETAYVLCLLFCLINQYIIVFLPKECLWSQPQNRNSPDYFICQVACRKKYSPLSVAAHNTLLVPEGSSIENYIYKKWFR